MAFLALCLSALYRAGSKACPVKHRGPHTEHGAPRTPGDATVTPRGNTLLETPVVSWLPPALPLCSTQDTNSLAGITEPWTCCSVLITFRTPTQGLTLARTHWPASQLTTLLCPTTSSPNQEISQLYQD